MGSWLTPFNEVVLLRLRLAVGAVETRDFVVVGQLGDMVAEMTVRVAKGDQELRTGIDKNGFNSVWKSYMVDADTTHGEGRIGSPTQIVELSLPDLCQPANDKLFAGLELGGQ